MHWADVLAKELEARGSVHVLATAITPSGPIHVGNMREVLTTEAVFRAVKDLGLDAELLYIGDTYDPLRKVYPFLDEKVYKEHVGKPLSDIPCPGECHENYAAHFLEPFLKDLEDMGVQPRVLLAHEMYRGGMYVDSVKRALDKTAKIKDIIESVSSRQLPPDWLPFNIQCSACDRITTAIPSLYEYPYIEYKCKACRHEDKKDIREAGGGKLPWRVDWPARWKFLDVTFEAMGKDHAASGGSWDTGVEIVAGVYDRAPPVRTVYEFVQVKGVGAMHSSTGTAVSASDMLRMTPPEVLRFLFMRFQPNKHIDFDTGNWIVDLVNDYDRFEEAYFTGGDEVRQDAMFKELDRIYQLSQPKVVPTDAPPKIPFNHLTLLAQLAPDWDGVKERLQRAGFLPEALPDHQERRLERRVEHGRYWLEKWAPEEVKVTVQATIPEHVKPMIGEGERAFFKALGDAAADAPWHGDDVQNLVFETAKASGIGGGKAFRAIYRVFLDKERGPRAGPFLASLDKDFVMQRLAEASEL